MFNLQLSIQLNIIYGIDARNDISTYNILHGFQNYVNKCYIKFMIIKGVNLTLLIKFHICLKVKIIHILILED